MVPATSAFARSAWTISDDPVTPLTGSEKVIVNGPVSDAAAVGVCSEMTGAVVSIVQTSRILPSSRQVVDDHRELVLVVSERTQLMAGQAAWGSAGGRGGRRRSASPAESLR